MSTLTNILQMAEPGSPRPGGERQNVPSAAGVAGLFAELMAQAQALSPGLPISNQIPRTPSQTNAETNNKDQQPLPAQAADVANIHSGKIPLPVVPLAQITQNPIATTVTTPNPEVTPPAIQSIPQTTGKPSEKTVGTAKTEKGTQAQTVQPSVVPIQHEVLINQIIAGTLSAVVPIPNPPVKLESNPTPSVPARATTDQVVANPVAAAQSRKNSGTVINVSGANPAAKEMISVGESPVVSTSSPLIAESESTGSEPKNESSSVSFQALTNFSETKPAANGVEHQSENKPSSTGQPVAQPSPDINGISIAKQDSSVKQADKTNNIAGQTEKVLPGNTAIVAQASTRLAVSAHPEQVAATSPVSSDATENLASAASPGVHSVASAPASNVPAVERMQEMVTLNAVRLSDSGNTLMQVVIKPDSGTQLSLELRQHGGSVEVQAVLQQGDFHQLNQQWPELQQRLGQRGIQLAPLGDNAAAAQSGDAGSFQQHQQKTAERVADDHFAGVSARQILPAIASAPVIVPAQVSRGWETWA